MLEQCGSVNQDWLEALEKGNLSFLPGPRVPAVSSTTMHGFCALFLEVVPLFDRCPSVVVSCYTAQASKKNVSLKGAPEGDSLTLRDHSAS